jgi:DNA polymerase-3 subunit epsilon
MEQRTLAAAYLFYCNKSIENAHNALADTSVTWEVLKAQVLKYENLEKNIDYLSDFSKAGNYNLLDFAGRIAINEDGEAMYNFGKNKGKTIKEISISEPGYYGWMLNADFPLYTKQCLKKEMERIKKESILDNSTVKINQESKKRVEISNLSIEEKLNALKNKFK